MAITFNNSLFQNGASGDTIYNIPGSQGNVAMVVSIVNTNVTGGSSVTVDGVAMTNVDGGTLLGNTRYDSFVMFGLLPGNHTITGSIAGGSSGSYLTVYTYAGVGSLDGHSYQQIVNSGSSQSTSLVTIAANAVVVTLAAAGSSSAGFSGPTSNLGSLTASHGNIAEVLGGDSGVVGAGFLITSQVSGATNAVFMIGQISLAPVPDYKINVVDTTPVTDSFQMAGTVQLIAQTSGVVTIPTGGGSNLFSINIPGGYTNLAIVIALNGDNGLTTLSVNGNNLPTALGWFTSFQPTWQYMFWQPGNVSGTVTFAGAASGFGNNPSTYFVSVYAGVSGMDGHNDSGGTYYGGGASSGFGTSITTTLPGTVVWGGGIGNQNTLTGNTNLGNNAMNQTCSPGFPAHVGDSGPNATPGSVSAGLNWTSGSTQGGIFAVGLAPFPPTLQINVSDTTNVTTSFTGGVINVKGFNVHDNVTMSESVAFTIHTTSPASSTLPVNIVTSAYKWLTSTLLSAQIAPAVRPYFTANVVDDTIVSPTILQRTTVFSDGPSFAKSCTSPDGYVLVAGYGNSPGGTGLNFWKVKDPSSGDWAPYVQQLVPSFTGAIPFNGWCSISCSDWINGSYQIDVYSTLNISGVLHVDYRYSKDGGVTWNTGVLPQATGINYGDAQGGRINYCLAAGKPLLQSNGNVMSSFFYIKVNSNSFTEIPGDSYIGYDIWYQRYFGNGTTGTSFNAPTIWSQKNANSQDWTINGIDALYWTGDSNNTPSTIIALSGFHNVFETVNTTLPQSGANYSMYITRARILTDNVANDLWDQAVEILPTLSSSSLNFDSFQYPRLQFDGTYINLLFHATTLDSTSSSSQGSQPLVATLHTNYYLMQSVDGKNFSYPTLLADQSGNEYNDVYAFPGGNDFVWQSPNYWTIGGTPVGSQPTVWQYARNNIVANVTNDILDYTISDSQTQPSAITLNINNAQNKWFGGTTTGTGAAAISPNKKIVVSQGYYNSSAVGEAVPRNIFYIDDIMQSISSTTSSLTLTGRDFYKALKLAVTRFAFNIIGPTFYSDIFDGTTIGNWNQVNGNWAEIGNEMQLVTPGTGDNIVLLSGITQRNPSAQTSVVVTISSGTSQPAYVYAVYIDSQNWVRLSIVNNGSGGMNWAIQYSYQGTTGTYDSGTRNGMSYSNGMEYTFFIRRYDWYKFSFLMGSNNGVAVPAVQDPSGNSVFAWMFGNNYGTQPIILNTSFGGSTNGEFDATQYFDGVTGKIGGLGTVGFGCNGFDGAFSFFKFTEFTNSQNVDELERNLGTKAGIFNYKTETDFSDQLFNPAYYTGSFSILNRTLNVTAGNTVMNNQIPNQISNGTIEFDAKVSTPNPTNRFGFSLIFRDPDLNDTGNCYLWNNFEVNSAQFTGSRFLVNAAHFNYTGQYLLNAASMQYEMSNAASAPVYLNDLQFDLTQWHHYKLTMSDGWMYGFIDGEMVIAWQDNNTTQAFLSNGYWGFQAETNTTLQVKNITSPTFWNQIASFSLNPGDDMESAVESLEQIIYGYHYSDLLGRFRNILIQSTDPPNYTYQNALVNQGVDLSDKEFYNQVKVYGANGITATSRDAQSIAQTGKVREFVVSNYQVLSYQDAQTLADQTLAASQKYQNQYTPQTPMNVGSELYDVVTIVNTGSNQSNVSGPSRIYGQTMQLGGNSSNTYQIEIDAGNNS